jgi:isoleucyl-tRNA synthetase
VQVGGIDLREGEFDLRLRPADPDSSRTLPGEAGIVALDLLTTPELEAEGTARDVIRLVQRARREAGLKVTDRIGLAIAIGGELAEVLENRKAHIGGQVLALEVTIEAHRSADHKPGWNGDIFSAVDELSDGTVVVVRIRRLG